jgi:hypothetical protein
LITSKAGKELLAYESRLTADLGLDWLEADEARYSKFIEAIEAEVAQDVIDKRDEEWLRTWNDMIAEVTEKVRALADGFGDVSAAAALAILEER